MAHLSATAVKQIEKKQYDAVLIAKGIKIESRKGMTSDDILQRIVDNQDTVTSLKPYYNGTQTDKIPAIVSGRTTTVAFDNSTPGNEDYCLNKVFILLVSTSPTTKISI